VKAAASYGLSKNWSLYGRVTNLLDRRYENPVGFLQPSLGVFAGIRTRF
jgi:vitamin B12 transporter